MEKHLKFDKLYLTNTIENPYSNVNIEPFIRRNLELENNC